MRLILHDNQQSHVLAAQEGCSGRTWNE